MTDNSQQTAIDFLNKISMLDDDEGTGSLEGLHRADVAETIRPKAPVPKALQPVVDRTIAKIAEKRPLDAEETFALEAIIIPDKRPVIDVMAGNNFATDHPLWTHFNMGQLHDAIARAIPAIGRIELPGHPSLPYGGTGFVVGDGLLMTNRHVAEIFCGGLGLRGLDFLPGRGAAIDLEKRVDGGSRELSVKRVAMIHPYWDMALLEVEGLPDDIAPLHLASADSEGAPEIVAIGYPAFDPRNDVNVQRQVFRDIYNVKRVMPGRLTGRASMSSFGNVVDASTHDSSTTGGASGSAVFDPTTGTVVALHFGGLYMKSNYGVPAVELARDGRVIDAGVSFAQTPMRASGPWDRHWRDTETVAGEHAVYPAPAHDAGVAATPMQSVTLTIPLTVTVAVGTPAPASASAAAPVSLAAAPGDDDIVPVEAPVADYRDRKGYVPDFLGVEVPLPEVVTGAADVLEFTDGGRRETELRYEHFSTKMSRSRRMCFFSAVNIDGGQSRKSPRTGWRLDPRIPTAQQIINECYGNPPKFSRGHMTRREDPVWGDPATAERGNADSMHVTNTTPQMQAFNSPIWLALERPQVTPARKDAANARLDRASKGDAYRVLADIYLRKTMPDDNYASGAEKAVIPSGSLVILEEQPTGYDRPTGEQYWAKVRVVPRVYIQYANGDPAAIEPLRNLLTASGFDVPAAEVTDSAQGLNEVRFFNALDRATASYLVTMLGASNFTATRGIGCQSFANSRLKGEIFVVELWVDLAPARAAQLRPLSRRTTDC